MPSQRCGCPKHVLEIEFVGISRENDSQHLVLVITFVHSVSLDVWHVRGLFNAVVSVYTCYLSMLIRARCPFKASSDAMQLLFMEHAISQECTGDMK